MVEGHSEGVTPSDVQENPPVPLHHPADGSPPRSGEDLATLAETAARLCKADLVTGMVGEFPELQGIMGGYYARAQGHSDAIADAIRDHYKPVGQGDDVPTAPVTVAVSLADKLDTIVSFFLAEMPPTGSSDPYALRRAALGVCSLVVRNVLALPLQLALTTPAAVLAGQGVGGLLAQRKNDALYALDAGGFDEAAKLVRTQSEQRLIATTQGEPLEHIQEQVFEKIREATAFIINRLVIQQRDTGVRHDLITAVLAILSRGGEDDLIRLLARVKALQAFVGTDAGANLLAGYKRAGNILKSSPSGGGEPAKLVEGHGEGVTPSDVQENLAVPLHHPADGSPPRAGEELALQSALDTAEPLATSAIAAEDFEGAMSALSTLRAPIDAFFEGVMVNDPDPQKRAYRIGLLERFVSAVHRVADFSKIEG
jgi:glycyl-tRNA synthetase beta chain